MGRSFYDRLTPVSASLDSVVKQYRLADSIDHLCEEVCEHQTVHGKFYESVATERAEFDNEQRQRPAQ